MARRNEVAATTAATDKVGTEHLDEEYAGPAKSTIANKAVRIRRTLGIDPDEPVSADARRRGLVPSL